MTKELLFINIYNIVKHQSLNLQSKNIATEGKSSYLVI